MLRDYSTKNEMIKEIPDEPEDNGPRKKFEDFILTHFKKIILFFTAMGLSFLCGHYEWLSILEHKEYRDFVLKKTLCLRHPNNTYTYKNWCHEKWADLQKNKDEFCTFYQGYDINFIEGDVAGMTYLS